MNTQTVPQQDKPPPHNAGALTHLSLRQVLRYEADDGHFYWIARLSNRVFIGDRAGSLGNNGYWSIGLYGHLYYEHRLVWFWHHCEWPHGDLDHINGDRWNNRIENLREATMSQNLANARIFRTNTSGHRGVSWNKRLGKWHAYLMVARKRIHLGFFSDIEEAASAYTKAAHAYFGEFARSKQQDC